MVNLSFGISFPSEINPDVEGEGSSNELVGRTRRFEETRRLVDKLVNRGDIGRRSAAELNLVRPLRDNDARLGEEGDDASRKKLFCVEVLLKIVREIRSASVLLPLLLALLPSLCDRRGERSIKHWGIGGSSKVFTVSGGGGSIVGKSSKTVSSFKVDI